MELKPAKKQARKEDIIKNISILDFAEEFQIRVEAISSGNFDYRCRCPSENHKGGKERTDSLYINSQGNNFHCFGCSVGGNCIDFYMLCSNKTFAEAIKELRDRIDPDKISEQKLEIKKNNFNILLKISNLFRSFLKEHPEDLPWFNSLMRKTDVYIAKINSSDLDKTQKLYQKIKNTLEQKYGE